MKNSKKIEIPFDIIWTGPDGSATRNDNQYAEYDLDSGPLKDPNNKDETHSTLVLSKKAYRLKRLDIITVTSIQHRVVPNPWEAGWIVFNARGSRDFDYIIPKPNGLEVGWTYYDAQDWLYTDSFQFLVGKPILISVRWLSEDLYIIATQNGRKDSITIPYDHSKWRQGTVPYGGKFGFYVEDSYAEFRLKELSTK